jgi:hypothetical protein
VLSYFHLQRRDARTDGGESVNKGDFHYPAFTPLLIRTGDCRDANQISYRSDHSGVRRRYRRTVVCDRVGSLASWLST